MIERMYDEDPSIVCMTRIERLYDENRFDRILDEGIPPMDRIYEANLNEHTRC